MAVSSDLVKLESTSVITLSSRMTCIATSPTEFTRRKTTGCLDNATKVPLKYDFTEMESANPTHENINSSYFVDINFSCAWLVQYAVVLNLMHCA